MKLPPLPYQNRHGFSLVEVMLAVGIMSFGFLALAPLLVVGLNSARAARENHVAAEIATNLIEEAKQGTLSSGLLYFDAEGSLCLSSQAAYSAQGAFLSSPGPTGSGMTGGALTRLTLRIIPMAAPGSPRIYVDIFPTPS